MKNKLFSYCFLLFSSVFFKAVPNYSSHISNLQQSIQLNNELNIIYQNNTLLIKGIHINGNIKIYSIIGNIIMEMNIQDFSEVVIPITLERQNLYIIRIETTDNRIFTNKIVAHWSRAVIGCFFSNAYIVWVTFFNTGCSYGHELSFFL